MLEKTREQRGQLRGAGKDGSDDQAGGGAVELGDARVGMA